MWPEHVFLAALALTLLLETLVLVAAWRLFPGLARPRWRLREVLLAGALPSALTLPYLWFVLPAFVGGSHYLPVGETLVVIVETPLLALLLRANLRTATLLSLACNAVSFGLGGLLPGLL